MNIKKILLKSFFCIELITYSYYYLWGAQGYCATQAIQQEIDHIKQTSVVATSDITQLESVINIWQHEPFLKEQCAREQLQLAHPDDIIYYIM